MNADELEVKVRDSYMAWNRHDAAGCVEMLAPDCILCDNGRPVLGREAIRALMQAYFDASRDLALQLLSLYVAGDTVLTEWRAAGVRSQLPPGFPAGGQGNETNGTGVDEFGVDGQVHRSALYLGNRQTAA
jgi:hypothetical protein